MDADSIQPALDQLTAEFAVPGAQLGLMRGGERVVLCSGSREVAGEPVVDGTAFHAGSLAKGVTGLVVLDAARRGHLDLDVACSEQGAGLWPETPRTLLSQTSGRPNSLPEPEDDLEDFVARTVEQPLVHEPGRFSYCNAGWSVLDLLLRRTTGRTFEEAASDLLGPGSMFGMPEGAAPGHISLPGEEPFLVPPTYAPAASAAGSQWWATADELLDLASLNLRPAGSELDPADVVAVRTPTAPLPGSTVFDSWGLGWAVWEREEHRAFGWAGYTGGHRAFLRCFPDQDAAVVLLANSAGPLFGPPGGSAVFDTLLPQVLEVLGVPALPDPAYGAAPSPARDLAGQFGPLLVEAEGPDTIRLHAAAFGLREPVLCDRLGGNTFNVQGNPPGSTPMSFDGDLFYVGPFALARA